MNLLKKTFLSLLVLGAGASLSLGRGFDDEWQEYLKTKSTVEKTVDMVNDYQIQQMAARHGLSIMNVTWEDTGRYKGSSVGPNISDVTLQVQLMNPQNEQFTLHCLPVIRYPNFSDKTADLPPYKFNILVGNEKEKKLEKISLSEYLDHLRKYLNKSESWKGKRESLLSPRDTQVLVSAQACFLPIPKGKKVEFNPVIFNYPSYKDNPAVLCILATREGTSATIIDNTRDKFQAGPTWGQRLFFNKNGKRAVLAGQRISDFQKENPTDRTKDPTAQPSVTADRQEGLNLVLLIQVPLKQKPRYEEKKMYAVAPSASNEGYQSFSMAKSKSDVEAAVIGHGRVEGDFTEIDNLEIERDPRFPVRVTVQFYKATSNGVASEEDIAQVKKEIDKVYENADYVGSLVVDGNTDRVTEYEGEKFQPPHWWASFWQRFEKNMGMSQDQALALIQKSFGRDWVRMTRGPATFSRALEQSFQKEKKGYNTGRMQEFITYEENNSREPESMNFAVPSSKEKHPYNPPFTEKQQPHSFWTLSTKKAWWILGFSLFGIFLMLFVRAKRNKNIEH